MMRGVARGWGAGMAGNGWWVGHYPSCSLLLWESEKTAPTLGVWHLGKSHLRIME